MSIRILLKTVAIAVSVATFSTFTACTSDNFLSPAQAHAEVVADISGNYSSLDLDSYNTIKALLPMLGDGVRIHSKTDLISKIKQSCATGIDLIQQGNYVASVVRIISINDSDHSYKVSIGNSSATNLYRYIPELNKFTKVSNENIVLKDNILTFKECKMPNATGSGEVSGTTSEYGVYVVTVNPLDEKELLKLS